MINQRLLDVYNVRTGLGRTRALAALLIPLACGSCFFATKSDFDRLQQDVVGTRATTNAADSVQRAYLIEVTRSVRTLSDSVNALSRRVNSMKTATESDLAAMKENISQLQDLSGQSACWPRPRPRAAVAGWTRPAAEGRQRRCPRCIQRVDHQVSQI